MADLFHNLIGGKKKAAHSGRTFENRNPANWDEIVGVFPKSGQADVHEAVQTAREAYRSWSLPPLAGISKTRRRHPCGTQGGDWRKMTREMGKVLLETRGDVQEGIDTAYFSASEGRRMYGVTAPSELPDKFTMSMRMPVGVAGIISPWNFPMAIPTWKIFPALVSGNTIVFKPASDTPKTAATLVDILVEAGLPDGVINIVHAAEMRLNSDCRS